MGQRKVFVKSNKSSPCYLMLRALAAFNKIIKIIADFNNWDIEGCSKQMAGSPPAKDQTCSLRNFDSGQLLCTLHHCLINRDVQVPFPKQSSCILHVNRKGHKDNNFFRHVDLPPNFYKRMCMQCWRPFWWAVPADFCSCG